MRWICPDWQLKGGRKGHTNVQTGVHELAQSFDIVGLGTDGADDGGLWGQSACLNRMVLIDRKREKGTAYVRTHS